MYKLDIKGLILNQESKSIYKDITLKKRFFNYKNKETTVLEEILIMNQDFSEVHFNNVTFKNIVFREVNFDKSLFENCEFVDCIFWKCEFLDAKLINCKFHYGKEGNNFIDYHTDIKNEIIKDKKSIGFESIYYHINDYEKIYLDF